MELHDCVISTHHDQKEKKMMIK